LKTIIITPLVPCGHSGVIRTSIFSSRTPAFGSQALEKMLCSLKKYLQEQLNIVTFIL
jgi:hypothetical protein